MAPETATRMAQRFSEETLKWMIETAKEGGNLEIVENAKEALSVKKAKNAKNLAQKKVILPDPDSEIQKQLGLKERLALVGLIDEGIRKGSSEAPIVADLFKDLWNLVGETVAGAKIDRFKPKTFQNGFKVFEVNTETGENLGRLNMLYLRKPIPCYYLVYVEVSPPFRRKGLGNQVLKHFREFLSRKSAIGILDNIIPTEDPTCGIYFKQGWKPIKAIIGENVPDTCENYMIYIPPKLQGKNLRNSVLKLVHHLKRKRTAIDMRDNEEMVKQTIAEFKALYSALLAYFNKELCKGESNSLMRFMFTRFVTKLVAFRRRIGDLIGYTGGDSLGQIVLAPEIAALPVQSYAPFELSVGSPFGVNGNSRLWRSLPWELKDNPASAIELLPNYPRPSFMAWLQSQKKDLGDTLTIGDLMDLGFDPTRLKEITISGETLIVERIQARLLPDLEKRQELLEQITLKMVGIKARNALVKTNPPLLAIQDQGNGYILRRKLPGIHWEEAVEQLQSSSHLKAMNASIGIDRVITATVKEAIAIAVEKLGLSKESLSEQFACFVPWNLQNNTPEIMIDSTTWIESVWLA